ncbi:ABC transporter substrate-binding protein [Dactylosporangium sp. CS-033363]|uniref:ABC transporter substrate-binding protein n=1 Tax=Dactylosporangium sp. CS-033363 TaxID=3239935 RepID=UPI003D93725C
MKRTWASAALAVAVTVGLAACGSDSGGDAKTGATEDTSKPITFGLLIPLTNSLSDPKLFVSPSQMAVDEINAAGGIKGHKVVLKQYDADFTTQGAITAMQKAIADKVDAVVGLPVPDQVLAVRPLLDRAKIPLLFLGGGYAAAYDPNSKTGASEWSFRVGPPSELTVSAGVQYAIKTLGAKTLGAVLRDDAAKGTNEKAAKDAATGAGGELTVSRTNPLNSTDVTTQILAMKGVNAVVTTEYQPGIVAVLKAVQQQGLNIPTIAGQTGMQVFLQKLAPDLVKNMYSAAPCNLADPATDRAKKWVTDFQAKYNFMPDPNAATAYDAFYLYKTAYEAARSSSSDDLLAAMESVEYKGGVCVPYKADKQHFMSGTEVVISFASGTPKTVATYDFQQQ